VKCQAGWSTSWNQDFWGEISITSDMQMTHPYGRKQRTEEPLDESERGEWKSWLKTQHSKNEDHGIWCHHFMENRWGNNENSERLFSCAPESLQMVTAAMKSKDTCSLEEKLDLFGVQGTFKSLLQTPQFQSVNALTLSFLYSSTLTSIHDYWKNHSFD